jgi:hypothetical protein
MSIKKEKPTHLVLTMAGKYNRFRLFGNRIPKYLLPLGSETILAEVVRQYTELVPRNNIYLIANRSDQIFYPILKSISDRYGLEQDNLIYIDDTPSQLVTALLASEILPSKSLEDPIVFANIDTVLYGRRNFFERLRQVSEEHSIIDIFQASNKNYSYARCDPSLRVIDVVDNKVISSFACSGLYGFGSFSELNKLGRELLTSDSTANFTSLLKHYLQQDRTVVASDNFDPRKTIVLGTPEEYLLNIHRFQ